MSEKLISHSSDLLKLRKHGYELEILSGFLVIHSVPYLNSHAEICTGTLVSPLELSGEQTSSPIADHTVWFSGTFPYDKNGIELKGISNRTQEQTLCEGLTIQHRFSAKPSGGQKYTDYYEKMTSYIDILSNPAKAINPSATACVFKPLKSSSEESIFLYTDSASSRNGTVPLTQKCAMNKVAIIGLGGTGSYLLDLIVKTHIKEIHLFDGDKFFQHNAFRAPGAASLEDLEKYRFLSKVEYYSDKYKVMRRGIFPQKFFLDESNINALEGFDFIFICVDKPSVRKLIFDFLIEQKNSFY
jgi:hypothetical protein